jgi:adenosylcobinamide kinase / adenosylcobinamide-phosphate guanylyltransferase
MAHGLTFLVGGARSGKSSLAVELGRRHDAAVVVIATAEPFDDDMAQRISRHRSERPEWPTVEVPVELADAVRAVGDHTMIVLDCLTVWVANLFAHQFDSDSRAAMYSSLAAALAERHAPTVVISNEVGLGIHPPGEMAREYRDELGRLNQAIAAIAERTLFLVAGRAVRLDDPLELLS